jgi:ComF family protein
MSFFSIFIKKTVLSMLHNLIDLFFPKVCSGCNEILLGSENVICTLCRHEIPLTNHHLQADNETFKKFYGRIPVEFAASLFYFHKKGIVQQIIHNLKYHGHQEIGTVVGDWYAHELQNSPVFKTIDAIIPVPIHKKRLKKRGYNQVATFAEALSKKLNIPVNNSLLERTVFLDSQSKKTLFGRSSINDTAIFLAQFTLQNHHKHYLLVDDVITTGATLEACSRALLKIPGVKISVLCMAYTN